MPKVPDEVCNNCVHKVTDGCPYKQEDKDNSHQIYDGKGGCRLKNSTKKAEPVINEMIGVDSNQEAIVP